ncbi:MAG: HAD family hydrolase, partial [Actinomycetota bacterium]
DEDLTSQLAHSLGNATSEVGTRPVPGAADALRLLKEAGIPSALICDTGFTPGAHVKRFLDEHGLRVDHYFFSDVVGKPKPHRAMFDAALGTIGTDAQSAVHIGDLRRTDIAGARAVGMGTIRFAGVHNDGLSPDGTPDGVWTPESPESKGEDADAVIYRWDELGSVLGL